MYIRSCPQRLVRDHGLVLRRRLNELIVRAARNHMAVLEQKDAVRRADRPHAVRNGHNRAAARGVQLAQCVLERLLTTRVHRGRRLIQQEQSRLSNERSCNRHALLLTAAQLAASGWTDCAVVNAGDGTHEHPTQALLDAFTLRRRLAAATGEDLVGRDLAGMHVVIVGDILHSRVARSNVWLLATLGAKVTLAAPPTLLPVGVSAWPCEVTYSLDEALDARPDAVMMLRVQAERMGGAFFPSAGEYTRTWGLTDERFARLTAGRGALLDEPVVMHPGPMLRGMEINYGVADLDKTAVLQQVHNGVHARMAVLFTLLTNGENAGI